MRPTHLIPPAIVLLLAVAAVGPRAARSPARIGAAAYGTAIAAATGGAARSNGPAAAARLPVVFAAMHLAWGIGFLGGCLRWGPPLAALRRVAGMPKRRRL